MTVINSIAEYFRIKYLSSPAKKAAWTAWCAAMIAAALMRDAFGMPAFAPSGVFHALILLIMLCACFLTLFIYVGSPEYQYLRTLPLTPAYRAFALVCQILPFGALYALLCAAAAGGASAALQAMYSAMLLIGMSTFIFHMGYKRLKLMALMLFLLPMALLRLVPPGALCEAVYRNIVLPSPIALSLCAAWLAGYCLTERMYEIRTGARHTRVRVRGMRAELRGLYPSILYKDFLCSLRNPLILLFYIGAAALAALSTAYGFGFSLNAVIAVIYAFIASTLTEEVIKHDMKNIKYLRALPISQRAYFKCKALSAATVLCAPSALFLVITLPTGGCAPLPWALAMALTAAVSLMMCCMQASLIMRGVDSPDRARIALPLSVFSSLLCPLIPMIYIAFAGRRACAVFCGGRA